MIRSFKDKRTEAVASGKAPKGFPSDLVRSAQRKLFMIDNASELIDLNTPPGNRLEALKGDRKGQHSVRINDQFRICFRWAGGHAEEVEITDYHEALRRAIRPNPRGNRNDYCEPAASHSSWRNPA